MHHRFADWRVFAEDYYHQSTGRHWIDDNTLDALYAGWKKGLSVHAFMTNHLAAAKQRQERSAA